MIKDTILEPDVLVIGAGMAGITAAISASEAGASTTLIDRAPYPGGLATASMVGTFCGLYLRSQQPGQWAFKGPARTLAEDIASASGTRAVSWKHGLCFLPYAPRSLRSFLEQRLAESQVDYVPDCRVDAIEATERRLHEIRARGQAAAMTIRPGCIVDASGFALTHELAGLPMMAAVKHQAAALSFVLSGLPDAGETLPLQIITAIHRGVQAGRIPPEARRISISPGAMDKGTGLFKFGIAPVSLTADLERLKVETEDILHNVIRALRKEEPHFRDIALLETASAIGVRTGCRPIGKALLTDRAVRGAQKPDDGIAAGAWPIEFWDTADRPEMGYFDENDYYLIPAGSLISAHADNLFFAGRNLYAEDRAHASARVIGTCMQMGLASGVMASYAVQGKTLPAAIETIRALQLL